MNKYTKLYLSGAVLYVGGATISYLLATTPACCAGENQPSSFHQQKETVKMPKYGLIDGKTLKNLIETKAPMIILDARNQEWDDGRRVPGAQSLPFDSPLENIAQAVPNKNGLVAIYCGSVKCPAGKKLAEKMTAAGYTHVLEYPGGIHEWDEELRFPTEGK